MPSKTTSFVKRLPLNTAGRDYVVGDIHGAYDLVANGMRAVKFDQQRDRLIVVGDLVDRGEQSMRALKFLQQHYVHAVPGNHEALWIALYRDGEPDPITVQALDRGLRMGTKWWHAADPQQRRQLIEEFRKLPMVIEVETERGLVGIVHADIPRGMTWQQFTAAIERGDEATIACALEGRDRYLGHFDRIGGPQAPLPSELAWTEDGVPGIDRIFVGHTPTPAGPKRLGNIFYVDTGAIFGLRSNGEREGHLTFSPLTAKTASLAEPRERPDSLTDVSFDVPEAGVPFGQYARQR